MTDTPPAPTLTVQNDEDPCPRVEVLISPMPDDAVSLTIWRNYAGTRSSVRGAVITPVAGDHVVIDYEVPLQTGVTYTCLTYDSSGIPSNLSDPSASVTIDEPRAWLQDPLNPTSAMPIGLVRQLIAGGYAFGTGVFGLDVFGAGVGLVQQDATFRRASFATATRSADITVSPMFGGNLPMAGSSQRRDVSAVPIEIRTVGDQTDTLRDLINRAAFPLLRTGPRAPMLPPLVYLAMPDVAEQWIPGPDLTIWTATGQSVMPPGAAVIIPTRTWNDVLGEASTWNDLLDLYPTWTDVLLGHT